MNVLEALILGILQGLTEFLPISSTAHLTIAGQALGLLDPAAPERWTAFIAVIQLGTLVAVLWYFRHDLALLARGDRGTWRLAGLVVLGTIPIFAIGFLLRDVIEGPLTKDLRIIGVALIVLGILMWIADRVGTKARGEDAITWRDALAMGGAQVFSLVPGASRSGTTLTGGLFSGLDRAAAARFSFLLSIPAIAASGILQLPLALSQGSDELLALAVGTAAAAVSGYLAIAFMLRYLRTKSTGVFVLYRVGLGVLVLAAVALGWL